MSIKNKMRTFASPEDVYTALSEGVPVDQEFSFSDTKKTGGKSIKMSLGRIWFNLVLPVDIPLIDEPVDKGKLDGIIKKISTLYSPDVVADVISGINREAFKMTTYAPSTFTVDSLILPQDVKKRRKELQEKGDKLSPTEYSKETQSISKDLSNYMEQNDYRVENVLRAGIKGSLKSWNDIMISHGYVSDIEGNINGPIKTSISDGYNVKDFYTAAGEARRGLK